MDSVADERRPEECPTAWFAVLEDAWQKRDLERAAQAERQLLRLGVRVRFGKHRRLTIRARGRRS